MKFVAKIALLYFLLMVAGAAGSCGSGSCPEPDSSEVPSHPIRSGTYLVLDSYGGELIQGVPETATVQVDRDARTVELNYTVAGGAKIVENYTFEEPTWELIYFD